MITLDQTNFDSIIGQSQEPVLVDFWAPWCGPCKMIAPVIEEIATEYQGKLKVAKINVDDNQELASKYGIMSIPTICLFVAGEVKLTLVGFRPKKELTTEIDRVLNG